MKRVAVIQPAYIPWKGYFDIIHDSDVFIFLDDVQYTPRDWRSRNKVKLPRGETKWLTVPVLGGRSQKISEVRIDYGQEWVRKHLETLRHCYHGAPCFEPYFSELAEIFERKPAFLSSFDAKLTRRLADCLGIAVEWRFSSELGGGGAKDERLVSLIRAVGGTHYRSGPAAKSYIDPARFERAGIVLEYHDYTGYPEYPQRSEPFVHEVTVLDLLFETGAEAPEYIWGKYRNRGQGD